MALVILAGLVAAAGQLAAPDSLNVPLVADTTVEVEIALFPPRDAQLPLWYQVSWGDGETLVWSGPLRSRTDVSRYHRYHRLGEFDITVRASDATGDTSAWSRPWRVRVEEPVLKWYHATTEDAIVAAPSLDINGNIYFGDENGVFYSVTPLGRRRWVFQTKDAIYAAATIVGPLVFIPSLDSHLYCIDTTGSQKWALHLGDELYCPVAVGKDGDLYLGTDKGTIASVTPRGKLRWKYKTGDEIASSPSIGPDGLVYVGSDSVYCLDPKGRRRWAFGTPDGDFFFAAPVPDLEGCVFAPNTDGYLYYLGPNGRLRWRSPVPDNDEIRPEVVVAPSGTLFFGSDGYYVLRKTPSGTPEVVYEPIDIVVGTSAVSDQGTNYVLPDDGTLYAFTESGRVLWTREVASGDKDVYYSPAPTIAPDGTVYATSWDGGLYAFRGDGPPASTYWPQYRHDAQRTGRVLPPKK